MSSASSSAATMTRCWATPSAFSLLRVRSCWRTPRSSSAPVTPSGIRGSGLRPSLGTSREPPRICSSVDRSAPPRSGRFDAWPWRGPEPRPPPGRPPVERPPPRRSSPRGPPRPRPASRRPLSGPLDLCSTVQLPLYGRHGRLLGATLPCPERPCNSRSSRAAATNHAITHESPQPRVGGSRGMVVRLRPTLPHRLQCSTIGAERLSFRVRNGTGRFPFAITAVTLWKYVPPETLPVLGV